MFDTQGTLKPLADSRFFSYPPTNFYRFNSESLTSSFANLASTSPLAQESLRQYQASLIDQLSQDEHLSNLNLGPCVSFFLAKSCTIDIGTRLESELLPLLAKSFLSTDSSAHFKAVLQDKKQLAGRLSPAQDSGYDSFLNTSLSHDIYGHYYPFAFNQHSLTSARSAFASAKQYLPGNLCLSGPLEICAALSSTPRLLHDPESYSPILVMGGVDHADPRLITCLKSYGPHLEFWALSNLLTPKVEQVSEQWTLGLTHYITVT